MMSDDELLIAYHERILATTRSGDRRLRSEKALAKLRRTVTVQRLTHWTPELPRTRRTIVQASCGVFVRDPDLAHRGELPTCEVCRQRFVEFDHQRIE